MSDNLNPLRLEGEILPLSPVNYQAWKAGYMPPSEHILIHNLIYEGARIVGSIDVNGSAFWLVVRGKPKDRRVANLLIKMMEDHLEDLREAWVDEPNELQRPEQHGSAAVPAGSTNGTEPPEAAPDAQPASATVSEEAPAGEAQVGGDRGNA